MSNFDILMECPQAGMEPWESGTWSQEAASVSLSTDFTWNIWTSAADGLSPRTRTALSSSSPWRTVSTPVSLSPLESGQRSGDRLVSGASTPTLGTSWQWGWRRGSWLPWSTLGTLGTPSRAELLYRSHIYCYCIIVCFMGSHTFMIFEHWLLMIAHQKCRTRSVFLTLYLKGVWKMSSSSAVSVLILLTSKPTDNFLKHFYGNSVKFRVAEVAGMSTPWLDFGFRQGLGKRKRLKMRISKMIQSWTCDIFSQDKYSVSSSYSI